jgi:hypothetical protein
MAPGSTFEPVGKLGAVGWSSAAWAVARWLMRRAARELWTTRHRGPVDAGKNVLWLSCGKDRVLWTRGCRTPVDLNGT